MLDITSLLNEIREDNYSIIKLNDSFPSYKPGQDLDIFCYNPQSLSQKILNWGNQYVTNIIELKVTLKENGKHIYVDVMENKKIHFRFDLYGALPSYKKLLIKPALFESIIENSQKNSVNLESGIYYYTPSKLDDSILRYIEFIEWYEVRPDKIKHLNFILKKLDEKERARFINKLHYYTALPAITRNELKIEHFRLIRFAYKKMKGKSLSEIAAMVKRKLFMQ